MADIATLGIAVKSEQVVTANDNLKKFSSAADQAEKAAEGYGRSVQKAANDNARFTGSIGAVYGKLSSLTTVLAGFSAALGIGALVSYADAWSDMQSVVGAAIRDMDAAPAMMDRLTDIANQSYSSIEQTTTAYARNVSILRDLGRGADDAATFTASLNNALVLTATRGERAASVQDALSKAMAVGKLQADGLETVLANGGAIAEALAKSLGTTVNGLRAMASEGKITSRVISDTLINSAEDFAARVEEMPSTVQDAMLRLRNNFTRFVGQMDGATSASARLSDAIMFVANNLTDIARVGMVASTAIGTYYAQALIRATFAKAGFTTVTGAASAAMGLFTGAVTVARTAVITFTAALTANPFGLIAVAVATAISAVMMFGDQIAITTDSVVSLRDYAVAAFNTIGTVAQSVGGYLSQAFAGIAPIAAAAFSAVGAAMSASSEAWRAIFAAFMNWLIGGMKSVVDAVSIIASTGFEHGFSAAGQLAYNAIVEWLAQIVTAAINTANEMVQALSQGVDSLNALTGLNMPNPFEKLGFDTVVAAEQVRSWKTEVTGAVADASAEIDAAIQSNMARDYIGEIGAAWSDAAREIAEARQSVAAEVEAIAGGATGGTGGVGGAAGSGGAMERAAKSATDAWKGLREVTNDTGRSAEQMASTLASSFSSFFTSVLDGSKSVSQAIGDVLKKFADLALNSAFQDFFSGGFAGGGSGILAGLGRILGFQSGGYTGNGPENRVAGLVHGREFVMNAGATAQYRPMLEAMNSNRPLPAPVQASGGAANGNVTVNSPATFHIDARGAQAGVGAEIRREIEAYDKARRRNLGREIAEARNMNRAGF